MKKMKKQTLFKKIRTYGISGCISYTLVSFILSLLNLNFRLMVQDFWRSNLEILAVCFSIAVLMLVTDCIRNPEGTEQGVDPVGIGLDLVNVAVPVIGLGGFVFRWFQVFSEQVLIPICILVVVYFAVFGLFYLNNKQTEKELNRKINERKAGVSHDEEDH